MVWCELVLRQIFTGVDGACRRRICELSPGGYRGVLGVSHAPTSDGAVRLSCECGIAGPRVVVSCAVSAPGVVTEETDGCAGTVQIRGVWRGGADATGLCAEAPIHTSGF